MLCPDPLQEDSTATADFLRLLSALMRGLATAHTALLSICDDKAVDALAHGVDPNASAYERNTFENTGAVNAYATKLLNLAGKVDAFDGRTGFQRFLSTNRMPHHKGGDIDMFFLGALLGTDVLVCGGAMGDGVHPVDADILSLIMDTVGLESADALRTNLLVAQQTFADVVIATGVKRRHHLSRPNVRRPRPSLWDENGVPCCKRVRPLAVGGPR